MSTDSPDLITRQSAIVFGLSGILGSLVLFTGDMLFYFNGESTDLIANMAGSSSERIVVSGVCALVAAWLYTLASGQIYYAFQPARMWIRLTALFSFAAIMIAYGVVHGAYIAIAVSAKNAELLGMAPDSLTALAVTANNALRSVTYVPFGIFSIVFLVAVWARKTSYPRWFVLFCPVFPFLVSGRIVGNLEGRWKTVVGGGYLNLLLLVFFFASTLVLARGRGSRRNGD
jgi:hypothetical protein